MQARKSAIAAWSRWVRRVGRHVTDIWLSKARKDILTALGSGELSIILPCGQMLSRIV